MARHQRDRQREQMWRQHLEQQRASGLTIRAYCESHWLAETSFYFWRSEIARRDRDAATHSPTTPAFVPVSVIDTPTHGDTPVQHDTPIDIRLVGGHRVRVRPGCDRALLADVIRLLRDASEDRPC